jgi:hypothetical protein
VEVIILLWGQHAWVSRAAVVFFYKVGLAGRLADLLTQPGWGIILNLKLTGQFASTLPVYRRGARHV